MANSRRLYEVFSGTDAPVVPPGLPLVTVIPGVFDAGKVCATAAMYFHDSVALEKIAEFDSDELIDYRSSRPQGAFDGQRFSVERFPSIELFLATDELVEQFLVLTGPEPDLRWQGLAGQIIDLCEALEVSEHVSIRSVPSDVPHTRSITLIAHANAVAQGPREDSDVAQESPSDVPLSFAAYLETRMEEAVFPSRGFVAQIPHYVSRAYFPAGTLALVRRVNEALGLSLPLVGLGDVVETALELVASDIEANPELVEHVRMLEEAFDARSDATSNDPRIMMDMPTADEIGDRLERYLAEESGKDFEP